MSRSGARPRRHRAAAVILATTVGLVGCVPSAPDEAGADAGPGVDLVGTPWPTTSSTAAPTSDAPAVTVQDASLGALPAAAVIPPVRLDIPSIDLSMSVDEVGVAEDGSMQIPELGDHAGWYRFGPAPGDPAGAVVMAAHVDTRADGLAPFARLRQLVPGDVISVASSDGVTRTYAVSELVSVPKSQIRMPAVFDRTGPARLVLVTCGGTFDRVSGHYRDNVVVTALPMP